jgi:hypothetical protein
LYYRATETENSIVLAQKIKCRSMKKNTGWKNNPGEKTTSSTNATGKTGSTQISKTKILFLTLYKNHFKMWS